MIATRLSTLLAGSVLLTAVALAGETQSAQKPAAGGQLILDDSSPWSGFYSYKSPLVRGKDGQLVEVRMSKVLEQPIWAALTPPPPAEWIQPDFDDSSWNRPKIRHHYRVDYGFWDSSPKIRLQCLRGRFRVNDPAAVRGLKLALTFRGGVVVYVNGKEAARAFLPKDGPLTADTLADDYPPEAFLQKDGKCILEHSAHQDGVHIYWNKEGMDKRLRELPEVEIKPGDLRKGVNVLALEFHRAPYFGVGLERENGNHVSGWGTLGLVRCSLRAEAGVEPNLARPKGVQVWATNSLHRSSPLDCPDPLESPASLRITACRNGRFTGKVMIASDGPLGSVKVTASDLATKDGKRVLPASQLKVLYAHRDDTMLLAKNINTGFWDTLLETPPADVGLAKFRDGKDSGFSIQPVFLKVSVPPDAAPGAYAGKLAVTTASGPARELPVELEIVDWKLPDPKDYVTHMAIVQSPESVAMRYNVPLWSEEHWKLVEKSFQLMGEFGNKYIVLPLICKTNFGNEQSMVRWVKDGDGWKYDFTVFDRYVDLAQKYQKSDTVCLYIWDMYVGAWTWTGIKQNQKPLVTRWDPATNKAEEMETPKFETPEGKKLWAPLLKEALEHLEKRGLGDAAMLGMNAEWWPTKEIAAAYLEMWPKLKWISNAHADKRGAQWFGMPIAYNTAVYLPFCLPPNFVFPAKAGRYYGWQTRTDVFPRGAATYVPLWPDAPLAAFRLTPEVALSVNCSGVGRAGADFWPVLGKDYKWEYKDNNSKRSRTVTARYPISCWEQVNMDTGMEAALAPGPDGAVPTERYEQIRQGVQDCEARIFIEKAILSGKLDAETVRKCWEILDDRAWHVNAGCSNWVFFEGAEFAELAGKLYSCAAEVALKLGGK